MKSLCFAVFSALMLSACCGSNFDDSAVPCYQQYIGTTKEERQRESLGDKRRPDLNVYHPLLVEESYA